MSTNFSNEEKLRKIFSSLNKLDKYKKTVIWEMGTDFIIHIKRWENLVKKIYDECDYKEEMSSLEIFWEKKNDEGYGLINVIFPSGKKIYMNFIQSKDGWKEGNEKIWAHSTMRQFFEVGTSFGYITVNNEFKINNSFTLQKQNFIETSDESILNNIIEIIMYSWDVKRLKAHSLRDVAITIIFTYYVFNGNTTSFNFLERIVQNNIIPFRNGKRNIESIKSKFNSKTSSIKKQTTLNKWSKENMFKEKFSELLNFIFKKIELGWEIEEISHENKMLEFYVNKNSRKGQKSYRDLMLNDIKRFLDENSYNRHDLILGIKNSKLVEAAHILDYKCCDLDEQYDPENGLLVDPTIHKYFDKDIIVFDVNGDVFVDNNFYKEVKKLVLLSPGDFKISSNVLTEKTKYYIEKRNIEHKINFEHYIKL